MNKRQRNKRFKKMLCHHGKFMCFECLTSDGTISPIDIIVTEYKSPGRIIDFDPRFIMDNATEPAQL